MYFLCTWRSFEGFIEEVNSFDLVAGSQVGIAEGHGQGLVAKQFLDRFCNSLYLCMVKSI